MNKKQIVYDKRAMITGWIIIFVIFILGFVIGYLL
jgi:hypothetical protein